MFSGAPAGSAAEEVEIELEEVEAVEEEEEEEDDEAEADADLRAVAGRLAVGGGADAALAVSFALG